MKVNRILFPHPAPKRRDQEWVSDGYGIGEQPSSFHFFGLSEKLLKGFQSVGWITLIAIAWCLTMFSFVQIFRFCETSLRQCDIGYPLWPVAIIGWIAQGVSLTLVERYKSVVLGIMGAVNCFPLFTVAVYAVAKIINILF